MDIKQELQNFKIRFDIVLARYLDDRIAETAAQDTFTADGLERVKALILNGGKRLRPALTVWSYEGVGGKETDAIIYAAMSVEIIHAFLLIHDDIMDRDALRHGTTTLHAHYTKQLTSLLGTEKAMHAGNSIALVFGDIVNAIGNHALFSADFDKERIFTALMHLQNVISYTGMGQLKDILFESGTKATVDDILAMYEYKTARYTIESPLILGAILAGAPETLHTQIHAFARPLGIAFQIRDDIIGLFGDESTIGKPVGSDISEGKMTLLVALAQNLASRNEQKMLMQLLGKKDLTRNDIDTFRTIITTCGARSAAQDRIVAYGAQSIDALTQIAYDSRTQERLRALADYLMRRTA